MFDTTTLLTSAVIATLISGVFSYLTSTKIESLKASIANKEKTFAKLEEAYIKLTNLDFEAKFEPSEFEGNPQDLMTRMISEHKAIYTESYNIYVTAKPYLSLDRVTDQEKYLTNVSKFNNALSDSSASRADNLIQLMEARDLFSKNLLKILEDEIRDTRKS